LKSNNRFREIQINSLSRKLAAIFLILIGAGILVYRTGNLLIGAWITRNGTLDPAIYERAIRYDPQNADYHFILAQIYNHSTPYLNFPRAQQEYEAAARLNPDRANHWLELSKYYEQTGDTARSRQAMQMALEKDPNYAQTHWPAANLYIRLKDLQPADLELRRTADLDVSYVEQVLDLGWHFYQNPRKILDTYVPDTKAANLIALNYFVDRRDRGGAALAWDRLRTFRTTARERFPYIDHLVSIGMPHTAWEIFSSASKGDTSGFFNPGFETDLMNGGFDWRFTSWENARARRDSLVVKDGFASFLVTFNGKENVDYSHLWHWLPVRKGASYNLRFWMKTEGVSTDEGMFVEVDGRTSEKQTGSNEWTEFNIPFRATTELVTVRLRRVPSKKLENLLMGKVWVDAFSLRDGP